MREPAVVRARRSGNGGPDLPAITAPGSGCAAAIDAADGQAEAVGYALVLRVEQIVFARALGGPGTRQLASKPEVRPESLTQGLR